eukprot:12715330-Prorocentrum_lima.AAC.1
MTKDLAQQLVQAIHVRTHNVEKQEKNMVHSLDHRSNESFMTRGLSQRHTLRIPDHTPATDEKKRKIRTMKK